jgi:DNA polymerase III epsilon subunit-like protein
MYLFFDTETTGLPTNYKAPASDSDNWPRLVQIAWSWYDASGNVWDSYSFVIKPNGFVIPEEVARIHRVTQERAEQEGLELDEVLKHFAEEVKKAEFVIGHNVDFDDKIVGAEFFRRNMENVLENAQKICTMKSSVNFCRIPNGRGGYKWPNLSELHNCLFSESFADAHDALVDVNACAKCFFELKNRNAI